MEFEIGPLANDKATLHLKQIIEKYKISEVLLKIDESIEKYGKVDTKLNSSIEFVKTATQNYLSVSDLWEELDKIRPGFPALNSFHISVDDSIITRAFDAETPSYLVSFEVQPRDRYYLYISHYADYSEQKSVLTKVIKLYSTLISAKLLNATVRLTSEELHGTEEETVEAACKHIEATLIQIKQAQELLGDNPFELFQQVLSQAMKNMGYSEKIKSPEVHLEKVKTDSETRSILNESKKPWYSFLCK